MPVTMRGGTSGNREDALPSLPGVPSGLQPVLDTSSNSREGNTTTFQAEKFDAKGYQFQTPDFMPENGLVSRKVGDGTFDPIQGTDVVQPDIRNLTPSSGDESVFKGAPNTGTKGGPA